MSSGPRDEMRAGDRIRPGVVLVFVVGLAVVFELAAAGRGGPRPID